MPRSPLLSRSERAPTKSGAVLGPHAAGQWLFGLAGGIGLGIAFALSRSAAQSAASQDWSPFVLVIGLLLVGIVADDEGLFAFAGERLARLPGNNAVFFAASATLIAVVTALLNLDTSVAFLTPVLIYAARSRSSNEAALAYGSLLLANAGSLLLPGSNLTNLIVLGQLHLTGHMFAARMALPWLASLLVTSVIIAIFERLGTPHSRDPRPSRTSAPYGIGMIAVFAVAVTVLVVRSPALAVMAIGLTCVAVRYLQHQTKLATALDHLGLGLLVGLFGIATALGTLGRTWSGPESLMMHLNIWGTAAVAALSTVVINNLPAASLFAAHPPLHPFALLIGLNIGPNLFATGSLAWLLWLRSVRAANSSVRVVRASLIGAFAVPFSIAASLVALTLTGLH